MIGGYQNIFRSRWRAILWALGICLTAYCTVPSQDQGGEGDMLVEIGKAAAQKAGQDQAPPKHQNPWARAAEG